MQLDRPTRLREALTAATCSLLAVDPATAGLFDFQTPWVTDSAVLYYSEQDRVRVIEPVVQVKKEIGEDEFLTVKLVYDSMSGATPNGATPTNASQSFTSPSGETTFAIAAHELPLIEFRDERAALSLDWELPFTRTVRSQLNLNFSRETDYQSLGGSVAVLFDTNDKLKTWTVAAAANADQIDPTGGAPEELSSVTLRPTRAQKDNDVEAEAEGGDGGDSGPAKSKTGFDFMLGLTQVVTRATLMQFNYSWGTSIGYLNDPYKIVSVIDGTTGATVDYVHEKRPDSRTRNTLYWKTVHHLTEDVINVAYRYYWDDWDITSHMLDLNYRLNLGASTYLEPHYRYYTQSAAKFYSYGIVSGTTPNYASSDLRLTDMQSNTIGLRFAQRIGDDAEFGIGADYMVQTGDKHPKEAIGLQQSEDLFTDLKAWSITADFSYKF